MILSGHTSIPVKKDSSPNFTSILVSSAEPLKASMMRWPASTIWPLSSFWPSITWIWLLSFLLWGQVGLDLGLAFPHLLDFIFQSEDFWLCYLNYPSLINFLLCLFSLWKSSGYLDPSGLDVISEGGQIVAQLYRNEMMLKEKKEKREKLISSTENLP